MKISCFPDGKIDGIHKSMFLEWKTLHMYFTSKGIKNKFAISMDILTRHLDFFLAWNDKYLYPHFKASNAKID